MAEVPPLLRSAWGRVRPALVRWVSALRAPRAKDEPLRFGPSRAPTRRPQLLLGEFEPTPRSVWLGRGELLLLCSFAFGAAFDRSGGSHAGALAGFVVLFTLLLTVATFKRARAVLLRRASFAVVLLLLPRDSHTGVLAAAFATSLAAFTITDALAGLRGLPGLAVPLQLPARTLRAVPYIYSAVAAACAVSALRSAQPGPTATALFTTWVTLAIFAAFSFAVFLARARALELAAAPRAWGAAAAFVPCSIAAAFAVLAGKADALACTAAAFVFAGSVAAWMAGSFDALRSVRRARQLGALVLFGTPLCLLLALVAADEPSHRPAVTAVAFVVGAILALWHRPLADFVGTSRSPWAPFFALARGTTERRHPFEAITRALERVQHAPMMGRAPVLLVFETAERIEVDLAGYHRRRIVPFPRELITTALAEPFATVREEVLHALEVRRPDLRALLAWLDADDVVAATVGIADGEPVCALLLPRGRRADALSLEELFEAKRLADVLAGHLANLEERRQSGALVDRLEKRLAEEDDLARLVAHRAARRGNARRRETERLASTLMPVLVAPKSRLVQEALERAASRGQGTFLVTSPGHDGIGALARAHLQSPRADEAFVVIDCLAAPPLSVWHDPQHSPLVAADRGLLVLQDVRALPLDVQRLVAHVHAERRLPEGDPEPLDLAIALTGRETPSRLVETGELATELEARLAGSAPLVLPEMAERSEDLRSLVGAKLAREGMRAHGRPIGISDDAFAMLVECMFLGGELEIDALAVALCRVAAGGVIQRDELDQVLSSFGRHEISTKKKTAKRASRSTDAPQRPKSVAPARRSTSRRR